MECEKEDPFKAPHINTKILALTLRNPDHLLLYKISSVIVRSMPGHNQSTQCIFKTRPRKTAISKSRATLVVRDS